MLLGTLIHPKVGTNLEHEFDILIGDMEVKTKPLSLWCNSITSLLFQKGVNQLGGENVIFSKVLSTPNLPVGSWFETVISLHPSAYWSLIIPRPGAIIRIHYFDCHGKIVHQYDCVLEGQSVLVPGDMLIHCHVTMRWWLQGEHVEEMEFARLVEIVKE